VPVSPELEVVSRFSAASGPVVQRAAQPGSPWELPGGMVEADESPYAAARREVSEELGWSGPVGRLLAVDRVPPRELRGLAWCTPDEAGRVLPPLLARRLASACAARAAGGVAYLENGGAI
jgi:8-oxo-dGTP diphosphatase